MFVNCLNHYNNHIEIQNSSNIAVDIDGEQLLYSEIPNYQIPKIKKHMRVIIHMDSYNLAYYKILIGLSNVCSCVIIPPFWSDKEKELHIKASNANLIITDRPIITFLPICYNIEEGEPLKHRACEPNEFSGVTSSGTVKELQTISNFRQQVIYMAHKYYYQMNLNGNDNILETLPKTGCWGIILFFITMILGAKFCVSKKSFKDSYEYYKPRIICAAPTQYKRIMKEGELKNTYTDFARIGGSYVFPELKLDVFKFFNLKKIIVGYGLSETGAIGFDSIEDEKTIHQDTLGTPNFGIEYKIINSELYMKGGFGSDWLNTHDLVEETSNGVKIIGRNKKGVIDTGGHKVNTQEVTTIIQKMENITDCELLDSFVCFYVGNCSEKDVLDYCKLNLRSYKIPKKFVKLDSMPVSHTGKTDFKKLNNY